MKQQLTANQLPPEQRAGGNPPALYAPAGPEYIPQPGRQTAAGHPITVREFLANPCPTLIPFPVAGEAELCIPSYQITGFAPPKCVQIALEHWDRNTHLMPAGVTWNAPRNRFTQS
jgi:hypothetical protein